MVWFEGILQCTTRQYGPISTIFITLNVSTIWTESHVTSIVCISGDFVVSVMPPPPKKKTVFGVRWRLLWGIDQLKIVDIDATHETWLNVVNAELVVAGVLLYKLMSLPWQDVPIMSISTYKQMPFVWQDALVIQFCSYWNILLYFKWTQTR